MKIELKNISKSFGSTKALEDVTFVAHPGTINAIIGENGAGKSTLMKVLFGLVHPDSGQVYVNGNELQQPIRPFDAINTGIGMLQQHFTLIPEFTVMDNIILGLEPTRGFAVNYEEATKALAQLFDELHITTTLDTRVERLDVSQKQMIEVARMLYSGANTLIFDEPTATLAPQEVSSFYKLVNSLKVKGMTIVLITHRLSEVLENADHVTVLRKGKVTASFSNEGLTEDMLIKAIVPEADQLDQQIELSPVNDKTPVLQLKGINFSQQGSTPLLDVSASVCPGEILGIAGVTGSGQKELAEILLGLKPPGSGSIKLSGEDITEMNTADRRKRGMVYIPEDRFSDGVIPPFSLTNNRLLGDHHKKEFRTSLRYRKRTLKDDVAKKIKQYFIAAKDPDENLHSLSGGNQQKLMLARELDRSPRLVVAHGPTRGLDVLASHRCYKRLHELSSAGAGIILFSTEIGDLLKYCHRIAVLYSGQLINAGPSSELSVTLVGLLMTRGEQYAGQEG